MVDGCAGRCGATRHETHDWPVVQVANVLEAVGLLAAEGHGSFVGRFDVPVRDTATRDMLRDQVLAAEVAQAASSRLWHREQERLRAVAHGQRPRHELGFASSVGATVLVLVLVVLLVMQQLQQRALGVVALVLVLVHSDRYRRLLCNQRTNALELHRRRGIDPVLQHTLSIQLRQRAKLEYVLSLFGVRATRTTVVGRSRCRTRVRRRRRGGRRRWRWSSWRSWHGTAAERECVLVEEQPKRRALGQHHVWQRA